MFGFKLFTDDFCSRTLLSQIRFFKIYFYFILFFTKVSNVLYRINYISPEKHNVLFSLLYDLSFLPPNAHITLRIDHRTILCLLQRSKRVRKIGTITTVLIPTPAETQPDENASPKDERGGGPQIPGRRRSAASTPGTPMATSPGIKGKCPEDLACACGRKFADVSQLYYHQLDLNHFTELYCYLCDKRFSKQSNFKRHNNSSHSLQRMAHICWVCNKSFIRYDNLQDHQLKKHSMIGCRHCHVGFPDRAKLKEHVQTVHKGNQNPVGIFK